MKKLILVVIPILLCISKGQSQDWSVYPQGQSVIYFTDTANLFYRLASDSVNFNGNTTEYYQEQSMELYSYGSPSYLCLGTPKGNILVGNKVVVTNTEVELHFDRLVVRLPLSSDSLKFVFYSDTLTTIKVSKRDTVLNGVHDSILTFKIVGPKSVIGLRRTYGNLILSKQNGMLSHSLQILVPIEYKYTQLSKPRILRRSAKPTIKTSRIYDFDVGDLFQYKKEFRLNGLHSSYELINLAITGKVSSVDSFLYNISRVSWSSAKGFDTVYYNIPYPRKFPLVDSNSFAISQAHKFQVWARNWENTPRDFIYEIENNILNHDTCITYYLLDETLTFSQYAEGLGIVYRAIQDKSAGQVYTQIQKLTYYKKGPETWGTQQYLDQLEKLPPSIRLYPSITSDILNIDLDESTKFVIINTAGVAQKSGAITQGFNEIDVSGLKPGLYFMRTPDGSSARFIKR